MTLIGPMLQNRICMEMLHLPYSMSSRLQPTELYPPKLDEKCVKKKSACKLKKLIHWLPGSELNWPNWQVFWAIQLILSWFLGIWSSYYWFSFVTYTQYKLVRISTQKPNRMASSFVGYCCVFGSCRFPFIDYNLLCKQTSILAENCKLYEFSTLRQKRFTRSKQTFFS